MSGTQRLDVAFSRVKETVEAQSGRFEFLKQALTLSSAGLAGFSIFLTEPEKNLGNTWIRIIIVLAGLGLLFVTGAALSGIASYANLLRRTETEGTSPAAAAVGRRPKKTSDYYRQDVVRHANACLVGLFMTALILMLFAAMRIFSPHHLGPEQALDRGRDIVKDKLVSSTQSYVLDSFVTGTDGYSLKYVIEPGHVTYLIKLEKPMEALIS